MLVAKVIKRLCLVLSLLFLSACAAPQYVLPGSPIQAPQIEGNFFTASDGAKTLFRIWRADSPPKAVILSSHGFNDYGTSISAPAQYFNKQGIAVYAYDQRGFGAGVHPGRWSSVEAMTRDLKEASNLIREQHPKIPLILLGESMGGAVVMAAVTSKTQPPHDGIILSAPAVWGRSTMPFYQRWLLWLAAHTIPEVTLTGRGLNITPSDNRQMLRALGRDPLVIKETRVDAINGLTDLMDVALVSSQTLSGPTLILYGAKDEVIRKGPTRAMLAALPQANSDNTKVAVYENGYHMLLRDLQAEVVLKDIIAWIKNRDLALPSGADSKKLTTE